ncbi:MAG: hypothetical protein H0V73_06925, partial [Chloroflexi bacterium]|nr:hypothetical protein [Chloroflexota bacterium]
AGPALGGNLIVQSSLVTSAYTVKSASASASCASGHVMLSGGGVVTTTDTLDKVRLVASYPSAAGTWTVTGSALVARTKTWSIRAYVVCSA